MSHPKASRLHDRFGRAQRFGRDQAGDIIAHDGAGRRYRLERVKLPNIVSDGAHGWGSDSGQRLRAIHLEHDPLHPRERPCQLARYDYSARWARSRATSTPATGRSSSGRTRAGERSATSTTARGA